MKSWRVLIIFLIGAAVALLVLTAIFSWSPWQGIHSRYPGFQNPAFEANRYRPPAPLALMGGLVTLYISGAMLLFIFPTHMARISQAFSHSWRQLLRLILLGLLAGFLVILAGLSSALAMGTFPLTLFLGTVLFLSVLIGSIGLAYQLGRSLLVKAGWQDLSPLVALLLGEFIIYPFTNIPDIGLIVIFIISSLGLGATIATRFGSGRPWSLVSMTEEGKE